MYDDQIYSANNANENSQGVYQTTAVSENVIVGESNDSVKKADKKKKEKAVKEKKGSGVFRKLLLSVSMGLCFGLFAGLGFVAVEKGGDVVSLIAGQNTTESNIKETVGMSASETGTSTPVAGNVSNITVVESDVSDVVEKVMPAMVSILNNYTETYESFFGQRYTQEASASGSGIIVSENDDELLVVTNYHVIEGAEELQVTFIDDSVVNAQIKGVDSEMDLAVIAIQKVDINTDTMNKITIATLGDSDNLKLGEPVIAIGNALGYGQSVTNGIVSAMNRELELEDGSVGTFIQTNAAINPGNSGGALLNMNGEVIGINSNKIGGNSIEGMGYAIPITSASPIISELLQKQTKNKVEEGSGGYMGINLQEVTSEISQRFNMPKGVYVLSVNEGSAAERAGIMAGDIITNFDGEKISSYQNLVDALSYYSAGDAATVTVQRQENGEYVEKVLDIVLDQKPE